MTFGAAMVKIIHADTGEDEGVIETDWLPRVGEHVVADGGDVWEVIRVLHSSEMTELYVRPWHADKELVG